MLDCDHEFRVKLVGFLLFFAIATAIPGIVSTALDSFNDNNESYEYEPVDILIYPHITNESYYWIGNETEWTNESYYWMDKDDEWINVSLHISEGEKMELADGSNFIIDCKNLISSYSFTWFNPDGTYTIVRWDKETGYDNETGRWGSCF